MTISAVKIINKNDIWTVVYIKELYLSDPLNLQYMEWAFFDYNSLQSGLKPHEYMEIEGEQEKSALG